MANPEKETIPEVFPTIIVAAEYGSHVSDLDVDLNQVTDYLRHGGLNDNQILDTTIEFSSVHSKIEKQTEQFGEYKHKKQQIRLFGSKESIVLGYEVGADDQINNSISESLSRTLTHELEHRIAAYDPQTKKAVKKHYRHYAHKPFFLLMGAEVALDWNATALVNMGIIPSATTYNWIPQLALAGIALAKLTGHSYQMAMYINNPDEQRARAAEKNTSTDMVTVQLRGNPDSMRSQLQTVLQEQAAIRDKMDAMELELSLPSEHTDARHKIPE